MNAQDAIARSIAQTETIQCVDSLADVDAAATGLGYETDYAIVDDGDGDYIDVWGWSDETPESEQEWRLRLV